MCFCVALCPLLIWDLWHTLIQYDFILIYISIAYAKNLNPNEVMVKVRELEHEYIFYWGKGSRFNLLCGVKIEAQSPSERKEHRYTSVGRVGW
jgi:hypothetical protein